MNLPDSAGKLPQGATLEDRPDDALPTIQATMQQIEKMATIGQLAGGMSHEFNNLLQSVVASLELVRRLIVTGRSGETERFITNAITSAQRAAVLNQRLGRLLRPHLPDPRPLALNGLLTDMESMLRGSLPHSIRLALNLAPALWETHCDANEAETALLCMLLCACEPMSNGGTVTVQSANADLGGEDSGQRAPLARGQYVCVSVMDAGPGMAQGALLRAVGASEGTMVNGLSTARHFARENKGDVVIQSEAGKGTTLALYLPRHIPR